MDGGREQREGRGREDCSDGRGEEREKGRREEGPLTRLLSLCVCRYFMGLFPFSSRIIDSRFSRYTNTIKLWYVCPLISVCITPPTLPLPSFASKRKLCMTRQMACLPGFHLGTKYSPDWFGFKFNPKLSWQENVEQTHFTNGTNFAPVQFKHESNVSSKMFHFPSSHLFNPLCNVHYYPIYTFGHLLFINFFTPPIDTFVLFSFSIHDVQHTLQTFPQSSSFTKLTFSLNEFAFNCSHEWTTGRSIDF